MFEISERLKTVAKYAKNAQILADIGTDHAYIPIYLCQQNKLKKAIACDINSGPLEKAKENVNRYNLQSQIELRLGNGLSPIKAGEADTVVIAGMGGNLIIDILSQSLEIVKGLKILVLQPQLDVAEVRRYLHSINFKIEKEEMLFEEGKFYTVINAVPGKEKYNKDYEYLYGKYLIDSKNLVLKNYILLTLNKYNNIVKKLNEKMTVLSKQREKELLEEIKVMKEVLECL